MEEILNIYFQIDGKLNYNIYIIYWCKLFSLRRIDTYLIDDDWIKEKNIDMDIVLPYKNIESLEEENLKDDNGLIGPDNKKLKWNDPGLLDLLKKNLNKEDFSNK